MISNLENTKPLYPPKDFIPTAIILGVGFAGIMAGTNWLRLGDRQRGLFAIVWSVAVQLVGYLIFILLIARAEGYVTIAGSEPWSQQINTAKILFTALVTFAYGVLGYILYRSQQSSYMRWVERLGGNRPPTPYLSWSFIIVVIAGAVDLALIFRAPFTYAAYATG